MLIVINLTHSIRNDKIQGMNEPRTPGASPEVELCLFTFCNLLLLIGVVVLQIS